MNLFKRWALFPALALLTLAIPFWALAQSDDDAAYEAMLEKGKQYYSINCRICHGAKGNGKGFVDIIRYAEKNGRVIETFPRRICSGPLRMALTGLLCPPRKTSTMTTCKVWLSMSCLFHPGLKMKTCVMRLPP